jgi:hypothetical protein
MTNDELSQKKILEKLESQEKRVSRQKYLLQKGATLFGSVAAVIFFLFQMAAQNNETLTADSDGIFVAIMWGCLILAGLLWLWSYFISE